MARAAKLANGIQVFRGSRPRQDVFAANIGDGCCNADSVDYDKLGFRTRFDNSLAHSNPTGATDKFVFPYGDGFSDTRNKIIQHINDVGVGARISILTVPTSAFVTGISVYIDAEEPGLTFNLITRNGLVLPNAVVQVVSTASAGGCEFTRTAVAGNLASFAGFGAVGVGNVSREIIGRDGDGQYSLEADEIALHVASVPGGGVPVTGTFRITVSVSYDVIHRAEL